MDKLVDGSITGLLLRVVLVYFVVLISMRLMGKREIGKLSVFDLVVSVMIAEVSAVALEKPEASLLRGVLIILGLVFLQISMSFFTLKFSWLRQVVEGRPILLISDGKINEREMRRTRYSLSDLMTQLREKDLFSIADVEFAVLETTGKLSVLPKSEKRPLTAEDLHMSVSKAVLPVPLIIEGKPLDQSLKRIEKSRFWLKKQIEAHGYRDFKDVFYCSIDGAGNLYLDSADRQELQDIDGRSDDL